VQECERKDSTRFQRNKTREERFDEDDGLEGHASRGGRIKAVRSMLRVRQTNPRKKRCSSNRPERKPLNQPAKDAGRYPVLVPLRRDCEKEHPRSPVRNTVSETKASDVQETDATELLLHRAMRSGGSRGLIREITKQNEFAAIDLLVATEHNDGQETGRSRIGLLGTEGGRAMIRRNV